MRWSIAIRRVLSVVGFALLFLPVQVSAEETVCIQCHSGQEGRLKAPVEQWRNSVHAANGISCNDCHGGDPTDFTMAMSPDRGFVGVPEYDEVPEFCGHCHLGVKEDYLGSAHGKALESGGPQCVLCHGSHGIQLASIKLINKESCTRCHGYERAIKVKQAISSTEATLTSLEESVASLHRLGFDMKRMKENLFAQRNAFRQIFHTVELDKIKRQKVKFDKELAVIQGQVNTYEAEISQRKLVGGGVALLLLLGGGIALLIRRSYHKEE
ncbi:MAG: cytochrome C [Deltaproteobacteria bacterium]|nr:cytochrome C [Deltaproteobacteria bacterium]